jgi:hypothetical protein
MIFSSSSQRDTDRYRRRLDDQSRLCAQPSRAGNLQHTHSDIGPFCFHPSALRSSRPRCHHETKPIRNPFAAIPLGVRYADAALLRPFDMRMTLL